ncbi:unnamed protein product [Acanthoscelides obtectus]|uniref:COP9 signalosome complex subunit 6 n=1 Tax=Acanthoscelides obtectus TaxID=200917 RepID=A0A9P0JKP8_ACAOB|nr:unnamed protein product [Acanthoscelides obtectus]CAK1639658.1 COP9 signalosome complex subunit 6 [Acanthoscelides obtectus]
MSSSKEITEMEVETAGESAKTSMDTTEGDKNVMAQGAVGSVTCSLHPLVIMNISEHWTRERAQEGAAQQVIGALIGKQKGRDVEIMNSFELVFSVIGGDIIIDRDYYNMKEQQFKQVFSDMDFIGWYTTGDAPNAMDIKVHKQMCEINESPIMLKLNPFDKNIEVGKQIMLWSFLFLDQSAR